MVMSLSLICVALAFLVLLVAYDNFELRNKNKLLNEFKVKDYWLIKERLKLMTPEAFEQFCTDIWKHFDKCYAYKTTSTQDGGKDVVLKDHDKLVFIECKHYIPTEENKEPVSRPIAQKLKGSMDYGLDGKTPADKGMIMTTSSFTQECIEYCNAMGIEM
jgi:HJR/Mrr/RecB family endonuclease